LKGKIGVPSFFVCFHASSPLPDQGQRYDVMASASTWSAGEVYSTHNHRANGEGLLCNLIQLNLVNRHMTQTNSMENMPQGGSFTT